MKHFDRFEALKVAWESQSLEEMLLMKNYEKGDSVYGASKGLKGIPGSRDCRC